MLLYIVPYAFILGSLIVFVSVGAMLFRRPQTRNDADDRLPGDW